MHRKREIHRLTLRLSPSAPPEQLDAAALQSKALGDVFVLSSASAIRIATSVKKVSQIGHFTRPADSRRATARGTRLCICGAVRATVALVNAATKPLAFKVASKAAGGHGVKRAANGTDAAISPRTLAGMDRAIANMRAGLRSKPVDLERLAAMKI